MVFSKKVLCAFVATAAIAWSAQAQISLNGQVSDAATSNGISGATLTLVVAGASTTSDANGNYTFGTSPVKSAVSGKMNDLVFKQGNSVVFSVTSKIAKVTADVYSANGSLVARILDKNVTAGSYSFTPSLKNVSNQLYVIKMSIGGMTYVSKMSVLSKHTGADLNMISGMEFSKNLAKQLADNDTLVVSMGGYQKKKIFIDNYAATKNVALAKVVKGAELAILSDRVKTPTIWAVPGIDYGAVIQVWDYTAAQTAGLTSTALDGKDATNPRPGTTTSFTATGGTVGYINYGWATGLATSVDESGYYGGSLHFYIRGDAASVGVFVGWTGGVATTVDLATYNYVADGEWHEITIPFTDFGDVDFSQIVQYCMFVAPAVTGGTYLAGEKFSLSDITWKPAP